ncbi:MAG: hypothetical protein WCE57_14870 [Salegentibacter sp.]
MDKQEVKKKAKKVAKKGAEVWAAKKGAEWTGSLLKWGAIAGVAYLGYKVFSKTCDHHEA